MSLFHTPYTESEQRRYDGYWEMVERGKLPGIGVLDHIKTVFWNSQPNAVR
jgi:hypothetical protein